MFILTTHVRPGIHESHLGFYYNKYFRKPLNIKFFGVSTAVELCAIWLRRRKGGHPLVSAKSVSGLPCTWLHAHPKKWHSRKQGVRQIFAGSWTMAAWQKVVKAWETRPLKSVLPFALLHPPSKRWRFANLAVGAELGLALDSRASGPP